MTTTALLGSANTVLLQMSTMSYNLSAPSSTVIPKPGGGAVIQIPFRAEPPQSRASFSAQRSVVGLYVNHRLPGILFFLFTPSFDIYLAVREVGRGAGTCPHRKMTEAGRETPASLTPKQGVLSHHAYLQANSSSRMEDGALRG